MNRTFLIARQEFIKFVTRRGFLFTLITVPVWIGLAAIVPNMLASGPDRAVFTVIDRSQGFGQEIAQTLARENAHGDPRHALVLADPPPDLVAARDFAATAQGYLAGPRRVATADGLAKLDAIVVIPADFGRRPAQFWSTSQQPRVQDFVQSTLTKALRLRAVHRLGDNQASTALDVEAALAPRNPMANLPSAVASAASVSISVGMAVLMLIVAMMNSAALLQGVIEEKSTRMIEVLLSCATPWEIVGGKIAGVVAVALFTVLIWVSFIAILGSVFAAGAAHEMIHAALAAVSDPALLPLIVLYFICGLLIYGAIFLAIGSMSASLADAQAYLGPSMMIIMLPNLFIAAILRAPNGTLATAVSYFPIYTPYIMLLRVGSHPPAIELALTSLPSAGVAALLVWKAGDIFSRHALSTEKPPKVGSLFSRLRRRAAG